MTYLKEGQDLIDEINRLNMNAATMVVALKNINNLLQKEDDYQDRIKKFSKEIDKKNAK